MNGSPNRRLRILTWHVHGSYLYSLALCDHELILPVKPGRPEGYGGRSGNFNWPDNVLEVPADDIRHLEFDCVLFQSRRNYLVDQHEILSHGQRQLPRVYLEHDPPREHPTDTRHIAADDANVVIVHVTPFNALMWDNGQAATRTIEHGVPNRSDLHYSGELDRGIVVVNNIAARGRRTGLDVFERIREQVPLDLAGMGSEQLGGLGDVPREQLLQMMGRYRFLFNPIRYTSLGLAVCEAMMLGMPIVGLATTEMPTVVENDASGYVDTDVDRLVQHMQTLLADPAKARALGAEARRTAIRRFGMERFAHEWSDIFQQTVDRTRIARQAV